MRFSACELTKVDELHVQLVSATKTTNPESIPHLDRSLKEILPHVNSNLSIHDLDRPISIKFFRM